MLPDAARLDRLRAEAAGSGRTQWRGMLVYAAGLHERSTNPPRPPFPYPWEEIGPGYCYGPAFGHWDLVHQVLDVLPAEPEHARHQLLNNLAAQQDDGLVPGSIWMSGDEPRWDRRAGHPPVWPMAVQEWTAAAQSDELIRTGWEPLRRQIGWFEKHRAAPGGGFFYTDIVNRTWESGIDEGVRFDRAPEGPLACVDATSHMYAVYRIAAEWAELLGEDAAGATAKAEDLRTLIRDRMFCEETGFFHDVWAVDDPDMRRMAFEGMWPVVVGAATQEQAARAIDGSLLNPGRFFTEHPISTVGAEDEAFELRMWRGPAWNSMTYWAARGCLRYGRPDAARMLLERALDASARQYERTGTVWEFYHPHGGRPEDLARKPQTEFNAPCRDYLGHNPLVAMARLYDGRV